MKIRLFFAWWDIWVGFYWDRKRKILYFCPVPCFGLKFIFPRKPPELYLRNDFEPISRERLIFSIPLGVADKEGDILSPDIDFTIENVARVQDEQERSQKDSL
jgi:hypothetical protein